MKRAWKLIIMKYWKRTRQHTNIILVLNQNGCRRWPKLMLDFSWRYQLSFRIFLSQNDARFLIALGFCSSRSPAMSRHCLKCEPVLFLVRAYLWAKYERNRFFWLVSPKVDFGLYLLKAALKLICVLSNSRTKKPGVYYWVQLLNFSEMSYVVSCDIPDTYAESGFVHVKTVESRLHCTVSNCHVFVGRKQLKVQSICLHAHLFFMALYDGCLVLVLNSNLDQFTMA